MKKLFVLASICLAVLLVSSCGASSSLTVNENQLQTNVVLSQNNFTVVKTVTGEASSSYVFGIGGSKQAQAQASALHQMIQNAELTGSQAIVNTTVSFHEETVLGVWVKLTAYAVGTVIEFHD